MGQCFEIKPSATADQHVFAALLNVIDRRCRKPSIKCGVEFFIGIHDIDQMMAHTLLIVHRRLAGADIHVTIYLLRIGIDDLAVDALRQL